MYPFKTTWMISSLNAQMLAIGDAVRLSVTGPCARRVMTTSLRAISRRIRVSCAQQLSTTVPTLGSMPPCCGVARSAAVIPSGWSKPTPNARGSQSASVRTARQFCFNQLTSHLRIEVALFATDHDALGITPLSRATLT